MNDYILNEEYQELLNLLDLDLELNNDEIMKYIHFALSDFCNSCKNPAIWCMGEHTSMLMIDFVFELKKVKYIIDILPQENDFGGYKFIAPDQIKNCSIDGIIISSFKHRESVKEKIKLIGDIKYLDLYDFLEKNGIKLYQEYYAQSHPYAKYLRINKLQKEMDLKANFEHNVLKKLIKEYVIIKDFKSAKHYARLLYDNYQNEENHVLLQTILNVDEKLKESLRNISEDSVLMLCIDGLRAEDLSTKKMPKTYEWLQKNTNYYNKAYSSSTSTYESLIPVYSENNNLKTKYYERNYISPDSCRFYNLAIKQKRDLFFYTDGMEYIENGSQKTKSIAQTITEKIWDMAIDGCSGKDSLFYLHVLYESHFSFVNPYTKSGLVADGTSIFFDFLEKKGGKLRTDYSKQHDDALRYIDDVLDSFLKCLKNRMVIYADHGQIIPNNNNVANFSKGDWSFGEKLLRIPLAIKSPEIKKEKSEKLISLMELNSIICALLEKKEYCAPVFDYVKVQRSAIYNPDFRYIYNYYRVERELLAFEKFIFSDGYKLVIYENGELFGYYEDDEKETYENLGQYINTIQDISVCNKSELKWR